MRIKKLDVNSTITVLLLDDNAELLDGLKSELTNKGYNCIATTNAEKAINIVRDMSPRIDILVVDYLLNGDVGTEVATSIRRFNSDIYIILLTGFAAQMSYEVALRKYEIDSYSEKSDNLKDILIKLEIASKSILKNNSIQKHESSILQERLKKARKDSKKTQADVAYCIGVVRTTICAYESGAAKPSEEVLAKLAHLYGVSMVYFNL